MNSTTPEIADIEARLREIERVAAELARLPGLYLGPLGNPSELARHRRRNCRRAF